MNDKSTRELEAALWILTELATRLTGYDRALAAMARTEIWKHLEKQAKTEATTEIEKEQTT